MTIREIPRAFIYTCDGCGAEHKQENAGGHYTDSRPPRWSRLTFGRDAYDYQGSACADATIHRLLCETCTSRVASAISHAIAAARAA